MPTFKPVPAKPSASLLVVRDGEQSLEVLVGRRNPDLRVAGGFLVFPGGALDAEDSILAEALDRSDELLPYRINAVRETLEEVGLIFTDLSVRDGLQQRLDGLIYFAHWVAPDEMAIRFDTRFFVATCPEGQLPVADGQELVETMWVTPELLVAGSDDGRYKLMFPTLMNLRRLLPFKTVEQVLHHARESTVEAIKPGLSFRNGMGVAHVPESAGLGITEWSFPYPIKVQSTPK